VADLQRFQEPALEKLAGVRRATRGHARRVWLRRGDGRGQGTGDNTATRGGGAASHRGPGPCQSLFAPSLKERSPLTIVLTRSGRS